MYTIGKEQNRLVSIFLQCVLKTGGKGGRGMRVASYDPDDPSSGQPAPTTYNGQQRIQHTAPQKVATISQNYNEKTMLLSSDDEFQ